MRPTTSTQRPPPRPTQLALAVAALFAMAPALAAAQDERHDPAVDLDRVVVRATPLAGTAEDLAQPIEVLAGEALDVAKAGSLGETVDGLPGVQSSSFGPGVGRPIVRGMDGARVQVLSDGLGSGDVSTVSVDHAVSVEPFLAEQIEVLKGPATLLYGSGAIGGAVNVVDGRVPEAATEEPIEGRAELRFGGAGDERTVMGRIDATDSSGHLVLHADALHRETGDFDIPGHAESAHAHEEHEAEGHEEEEGASGTLPGSAIRTDSAALGMSWVGERGFVGAAHSLYATRYGVPGHAHGEEHAAHEDEEHEHGEGVVRIELDQRRDEFRAGLDRVGPFETLRLKMANTGYVHTEYEGDAVGTVFENDALEARLELVHGAWAGWRGAFGAQAGRREFVAVGDEAFVPGSSTRDTGLFWIGQRTLYQADGQRLDLELGARHDNNRIDVSTAAPDRDFDTTSASAALKWEFGDAWHATLGLDRAQRAPTAEELYSDGVHVATGSVELGDADLGVETASRAELGLEWHGERIRLGGAVYRVAFDDFISLADTGATDGDLPVRQWRQADADFTGFEAEADISLAAGDAGYWDLRVFADHVRARLSDGTPLPRIVAPRLGADLRWEHGPWRASLGATRTLRQDDVAPGESVTPGYTLVEAHAAWHADTAAGNAWEVFVDATNLLDEEARPHTSLLKDLSPLPGRGIAFGVRAFF